MTTDTFVVDTVAAIVEDRRVEPPTGGRWEAFRRADDALAPLAWQIAEMPEHQLTPVAEYLAGILDREPLRSKATWEPHRIVLGLFLLALRDVVASIAADEARAAELRRDLRPAWYEEAIAAVIAGGLPDPGHEDPSVSTDEIADFFA